MALEGIAQAKHNCSICNMHIDNNKPHIIFIDDKGIYDYCSARCMDMHAEMLTSAGEEEGYE